MQLPADPHILISFESISTYKFGRGTNIQTIAVYYPKNSTNNFTTDKPDTKLTHKSVASYIQMTNWLKKKSRKQHLPWQSQNISALPYSQWHSLFMTTKRWEEHKCPSRWMDKCYRTYNGYSSDKKTIHIIQHNPWKHHKMKNKQVKHTHSSRVFWNFIFHEWKKKAEP